MAAARKPAGKPAGTHERVERLKIDYCHPDDLTPNPQNPRVHSEAEVDELCAVMRRFKWTVPILASPVDGKRQIVAGHRRRLAALKLGLAEVPYILRSDWTAEEIAAYTIADNKLTINGAWDDSLLRVQLKGLADAGFDLSLTGFNDEELAALFAEPTAGNTDPDDVPDALGVPVSRPKDVWVMGAHRLVCGDCTDGEFVEIALGKVRPNLMVTDPPYAVNYDPAWRSKLDDVKRSTGKVKNDDVADWKLAYDLFPGEIAYVWHSDKASGPFFASLEASGFKVRSQIIWVKPHFVLSQGDYHSQHEPCYYAVRKKGDWRGDRKQSTVWQIDNGTFQGGAPKKEDTKTGHGTQKPVECMRRAIENNSNAGHAVYDPFVGSGTTIIACELTGRAAIAIDIDPSYVDVAVMRWQAFTGKTAVRESDGKSFAEAAKDAGIDLGDRLTVRSG